MQKPKISIVVSVYNVKCLSAKDTKNKRKD